MEVPTFSTQFTHVDAREVSLVKLERVLHTGCVIVAERKCRGNAEKLVDRRIHKGCIAAAIYAVDGREKPWMVGLFYTILDCDPQLREVN